MNTKHLAVATQEQVKWMLPVFYINLNTSELPDLDAFDAESAPPEPGTRHGSSNTQELVEGAGGTVSDLAASIVTFIHNTIPEKDTAINDIHIHLLRSPLIFVGRVDPAVEVPFKYVRYLGEFAKDYTAIDAGLLRALITSAQCPLANSLRGGFQLYFYKLLTSTLIHHRVLSAVQGAIPQLCNPVDTAAFKECASYELWTEFYRVANERLEVLTAQDSRDSRNVKACDNLEQRSKLDVKTAFRRCSESINLKVREIWKKDSEANSQLRFFEDSPRKGK
ncbi:hypothetical protein C8R45DRAFT_923922 [Mycena sanguinolenta]|nr:hypothetical protein C8R45DRAFT_923922 [Mycena sanguinolenta]